MNQRDVFVLKDQDANYVGVNSITEAESKDKVLYSYSKFLIGGFNTYPDFNSAENDLKLLQNYANKVKINICFHIDKINLVDTIIQEGKCEVKKEKMYTYISKKLGGLDMEFEGRKIG